MLHFATHGIADETHPETSGLFLSSVTESGHQRNGLLSLAEIYDLDLAAELVVLSACDTARGKEIVGEGPVSLARGFLISGARQVLASLWPVEDRTTRQLMEAFYEAWTSGLSASSALRQAQLSMASTGRVRTARSWAAFVLVGTAEMRHSDRPYNK